jgi:phosphohistidine phosphatase
MDLILWRHAEAEDGVPDAKRALTPRGEKQAKKMAKWLTKHLPQEARIIVSPALRCQQTADALGRKFDTSKQVGTGAGPRHLIQAAGWPNGEGTVLVVGHQPTLGQVAAQLLAGSTADWNIKKGAVWWLAGQDGDDEVLLRAALGPDFA